MLLQKISAAVMRTIRQTNPQAEFLLVSTMRFDPAYTDESRVLEEL